MTKKVSILFFLLLVVDKIHLFFVCIIGRTEWVDLMSIDSKILASLVRGRIRRSFIFFSTCNLPKMLNDLVFEPWALNWEASSVHLTVPDEPRY